MAAVRDPVLAEPQASAVVLDAEGGAGPDGCAAHKKLLRVPGFSVPPVGAAPFSVLGFVLISFLLLKKTRKPKTAGHRILSVVPAPNCSKNFCFYYRPCLRLNPR